MSSAVVLFTRDLRVRDHAALAGAVRDHDQIVPAFVLDDKLVAGRTGKANRLAFLLESLLDLDASLRARGAPLVIVRGDVVTEVLRLARAWNADAIYMSDDTSPYATARRRLLETACSRERIELRTFPGVAIVSPGELTPAGGDHYRVFTPYWRAWRAVAPAPALPAPRRIAGPAGLHGAPHPSLRELTPEPPSRVRAPGGERAGRERLARWLRGGIDRYEARHDELAAPGTSELSAYLHFGCLSAGSVLARVPPGEGGEAFARQLCWRDFHLQVLAARPDLPREDYRPRGDRWREDEQALDAWRRGLTGYPIVDAGMRQLRHEGFMHNRARLVTASFLTKTLYIDWRLGAAHYAGLLLDADVANNVGNWQWVAGTGNDTRPNRILNPLRQAHRFDPRGDYVRRHVAELADIDGPAVHEPWRLAASARRTIDYPAPIVDHASAAERLRRGRAGAGMPPGAGG